MRTLVCHNPGRERHTEPLNAFAEGLRSRGHEVEEIYSTSFLEYSAENFDMVVIFGSGNIHKGFNGKLKHTIMAVCEEFVKPFVMLEEAYVKRGEYWAVGIDGLAGAGLYTYPEMDQNRIDKITTYKPFEWSGRNILLCKQIEADVNVGIPPRKYRKWLDDIGLRLADLGYPVVVREHPRVKKNTPPIAEALKNSRFLVTYSSTSAVDAALVGVPFYVEAKHHALYSLGMHDLEEFNGMVPTHDDQRRALNDMANGQWTENEMISGQCWDHFEHVLEFWR